MKLGDSVRGMKAPRFSAHLLRKVTATAARQSSRPPTCSRLLHLARLRTIRWPYASMVGVLESLVVKVVLAGVETCVLNALPAFPGSHTAVDPFFLNARMVGSRHQKVVLCGRCGVPLALHAASCVEMFKNGGNWKLALSFFYPSSLPVGSGAQRA